MSIEQIIEGRTQDKLLTRTFELLENQLDLNADWLEIEDYITSENHWGLCSVSGYRTKLEVGDKSFNASLEYTNPLLRNRMHIPADDYWSRFRVRISSESNDTSFVIPINIRTSLASRAELIYRVLRSSVTESYSEDVAQRARELESDFYGAITVFEDLKEKS